MADAEEPQFTSIKDRIAALKLQNAGAGGGPSAPPPKETAAIPSNTAPTRHSPTVPMRKVPGSNVHGLGVNGGASTDAAARAVPPVPHRPAVPPRHEAQLNEGGHAGDQGHDGHGLARPGVPPRPAAPRPTPTSKSNGTPTPRHMPPPPAPAADEDTRDATGVGTAPSLPRRPSAALATPSTTDSPSSKRIPPPVPAGRRPVLPNSSFAKSGPGPTPAESETKEGGLQPGFVVHGGSAPSETPAADDGGGVGVPTSVAARAAAFGNRVPFGAGSVRPHLRSTPSHQEEQPAPTPARPAVPSRPPVPTTARPPLPSSSRPALPTSSRPVPPKPVANEEDEAEDEPTTSVAARAATLGRRLPPFPSGKVPASPPIPNGHEAASTAVSDTLPLPVPSSHPAQPPPIPSNRPPPVPMASRPRAAPALAPAAVDLAPAPPFDYDTAPRGPSCLLCRDFSAPDQHAAQFPLASLPRDDPVGYLAAALCAPFGSATDKARAIFTWCHHNIAYDVEGFFGGCIPRGQTTNEQIFSGKAVCEGYANIFGAIAQRAGLDAIQISGHGKGFGFNGFQPGERLPADITGHAWNAVRIDGGEWHLVDACWGAGAVRPGEYIKRFEPTHFNASNEVFGTRHYPADCQSFFRADGARPTFEAYLLGDGNGAAPPEFYGPGYAEGFDKTSLQPNTRQVSVAAHAGDHVRFLVSHVCEHWDPATHGPGPMYPLVLTITAAHGASSGRPEQRPVETDGFWYWVDVPAQDLTPGGQVHLSLIETINGESARGRGSEYFVKMKGRSSMSWTHVAMWDLV